MLKVFRAIQDPEVLRAWKITKVPLVLMWQPFIAPTVWGLIVEILRFPNVEMLYLGGFIVSAAISVAACFYLTFQSIRHNLRSTKAGLLLGLVPMLILGFISVIITIVARQILL